MKKRAPYVYCVCRVDTKTWKTINDSLKERGYINIKCFVPTVQVLSRSKGHKQEYKEIPMLFNYGFIRMNSRLAYNRQFIRQLTREIPGIVSFLKSLDYMHPKKLRKRIDNAEDWDDFSKVAIVSKKDIKYYKKLSKSNQIYHLSDIANKSGDMIILRKYPFDGLLAKVLDFSFTNKTVRVEIYPGQGSIIQLQLPLDNVLYTPYDSYNEDVLLVDKYKLDVDSLSEEEPFEEISEIY